MTDRLLWLDIAKGIAIVLTIIGHTMGGRPRMIIFSFHMPLFFLLAGYTIKQVDKSSLAQVTRKDVKRLILPVFIMRGMDLCVSVLYYRKPLLDSIWDNVARILWGNGNDFEFAPNYFPIAMRGVGVLWFLIALFWSKLAYRIFDIFVKRFRFPILLAGSVLGIWWGGVLIRLPQSFDMIPLIMLFMELGRYLREKVDMSSGKWKMAGIVSLFIWLYLVLGKGIQIEMAVRKYPYSLLCVLTAVLGCAVMIRFSQMIEKLYAAKALAFLGKCSLDLLCIHHLDGYYSRLWKIVPSVQKVWILPMDQIWSSCARVVMDVIILVLWTLIKDLLKNHIAVVSNPSKKSS